MELTKFCMDFVWIVMVLGMDFLLELGCEGVKSMNTCWEYGNYDFGMDY